MFQNHPKIKNPNHLDYYGTRELAYLPSHFVTCDVSYDYSSLKENKQWITENLNGRFYINKRIFPYDDGNQTRLLIGFENESELTLFLIAKPS